MQKSIIASIAKVVLILALITLFDMFAAIYLIVMDRSLIPVKTLLITMGDHATSVGRCGYSCLYDASGCAERS